MHETKNNQINLDDLIDAITSDNLHSEISTGQPVGNEIWEETSLLL